MDEEQATSGQPEVPGAPLGGARSICTVGHGTAEQEVFAQLLRAAGVELVVDVRRYPGSRRYPHFGREAMEQWLPEAGVEYTWLASLGGRRRVRPDSFHVGLRNEQFRAYAEHMDSGEFHAGVAALLELAAGARAAVMCSESVWWRCHRRLLADHLVLVEGVAVRHLFHDGRLTPHPPTPEARRDDDHLVYEGAPAD